MSYGTKTHWQALVRATISLREHKGHSPNERVDGLMYVGMFKSIYANSVFLPECFMGMDGIFYRGNAYLPSVVKSKLLIKSEWRLWLQM